MKIPMIVTLSLSEITSAALTEKLRPLHIEAMGGLQFLNVDKKSLSGKFSGTASLVILNLPPWSNDFFPCIQEIQSKNYAGPILVFVKDFDHWASLIAASPRLSQLKLLARPFEDAQLLGCVRRLLAVDTAHFRAFPRYETNQPIQIVASEAVHACTMKNVSRGGVCVEFSGGVPVAKDDFVTLNVTFEGNELHNVRGRIAWVQPYKALAGVEFVKTIEA